MFKDIANLIYTTEMQDEEGYPIQAEVKTEVFVNKKSVARTEFYIAMQSGMKPSVIFELRTEDYELTKHVVNSKTLFADKVEYDGGQYDIIRTYAKGESMIELTCG